MAEWWEETWSNPVEAQVPAEISNVNSWENTWQPTQAYVPQSFTESVAPTTDWQSTWQTYETQHEQPMVGGTGSFFGNFLDVLGTPYQAVAGVMSARPGESFTESAVRGMRENASSKDIMAQMLGKPVEDLTTTETIAGLPFEALDPTLLIPSSWMEKLFSPVGKTLKYIAKPGYEWLSKQEKFVNFAQKIFKNAFIGPEEKALTEVIELNREVLGIDNLDIIKDIYGKEGTGALDAIAVKTGQETGRDPAFIKAIIRQGVEYKIPEAPSSLALVNPVAAKYGEEKLSKILQKELLMPTDMRVILKDPDSLSKLMDEMGAPTVTETLGKYEFRINRDQQLKDALEYNPLTGTTFASIGDDQVVGGIRKELGYTTYKTKVGVDNPLIITRTTDAPVGGGEGRAILTSLLGEEKADIINKMGAADMMRYAAQQGVPEDAISMIMQTQKGAQGQLLTRIATDMARQQGHDAVLFQNLKGEFDEIAMLYPSKKMGYAPDIAELAAKEPPESFINAARNGTMGRVLNSAREVTDAIKDMGPIPIPKEITEAIFAHKRSMENIFFKEGIFGTPGLEDTELDYLFHMTTDEGRKGLGKIFEARFGSRKINPTHMSMLHRAVRGMGIDAANTAYNTTGIKIGKYLLKGEGKLFETDLNAIEAFRRMRSAKMEADGNLLMKAKSMFSRPRAEAPPGWEELSFVRSRDPRYKKLRAEFKDAMFSPEHAKHLNAITEFVSQPGQMGGFMDMLWKLRGNWVSATLYSPVGGTATLVKNEAGNLLNNWLAGMGPESIHWYADAQGLVSGRLKSIKLNGVEYTRKEIMNKLKEFAIFGGGYGPSEMSQFLQKYKREPFVLKGKYNPMRQLEKAYRVTEDNSRVAHFLWAVNNGKSFMEARASVKKYLFDYMIQSDLDRKIRTFVPFYQWTKNNIPLQLSAIVKNPFNKPYVSMAHLASLMRDNQAARKVDEFHKSVLPEFVRDQIGIPTSMGEDGNPQYFMFGNWVPAAELESLFHPLKKAMAMVAPYFKMPIEQAFNYDLFLQRKIEDYPGETQKYFNADVRRRLVHFSKLFRFVNELDKLAQPSYGRELDQPTLDLWGKAMRQVFGAQKVKVNLEFGERKRQREIRDILMHMRNANDTEYASLEDYLDELTQE